MIKLIPKKIPSARNSRNRQVELERRHSFRAKGSKSCSSISNSNQNHLYATIGHSGQSQYHHPSGHGANGYSDPLSKSMSAYERVKTSSKTPQNSPKTTELINSFQRQNRGLYKQVRFSAQFRVQMRWGQNQIKILDI